MRQGIFLPSQLSVKTLTLTVPIHSRVQSHALTSVRMLKLTLQKHLCPPLSSLGLIIVTRSSQAALNISLKNYKKVQNSAARLVLKAHKRDLFFTPSQDSSLAAHQSMYQISSQHSVTQNIFSDIAPVYLSDLLRVYSPSRQLRSSSDSRTLRIPNIKTKTFG